MLYASMIQKACFNQIQLHPKSKEHLSGAPIPRFTINQSHSLKDPSLRFPPIPTPGLLIPPSLQIDPLPRPSLTYPATVELPALHMLRVPSQIPLERRPRRPSRYPAAYGAPGTYYDIYPTVNVGVLGFRVGFQVGGFAGPFWVLPYDECFVQGVEALSAKAGGVDGTGLWVRCQPCLFEGLGQAWGRV